MLPVDVYELARTATGRAGELPLARLPRLGASLVRLEGMLAYDCQGLVDGLGRPALRLHLRAPLVLRCDRCSGELQYDLDVHRVFYFVDSEAALAAAEIDDAPEEALLGSDRFDLAGLIEDEAILQLPLSPRHERCARQLMEGRPAAAVRPNPFAVLQSLRAPPEGVVESSATPPPSRRKPKLGGDSSG